MEFKVPKKYTIEYKLKVIDLSKATSIHQASEDTGVDRKRIREWISNENELKQCSNKTTRKTLHKGKTPESYAIENQLIEFIIRNRKMDNPVTSWELIHHLLQLEPSFQQKTMHALQMWSYKFMKRNNFTFRQARSIGQSIPNNLGDLITGFLKEIINIRNNNIQTLDLECIGNMDETPLYFSMAPTTTIETIGKKEVKIRTMNQEKIRYSAVLTVLANGKKLPPLLIFKAKPNKKVEKQLSSHIFVQQGKVLVQCQQNAWCSKQIFKIWFAQVWRRYCYFYLQRTSLLVLDKATTHNFEDLDDKLKEIEGNIVYIPQGLTRFLQPLDFSINKLVKDAMKKRYVKYCLEKGEPNTKISRETVINWIEDIWYNNIDVSAETIVNSFKKCGISNSLDGKEDDLFEWPDEVSNNYPLKKENDNSNSSSSYNTEDEKLEI